MGKKNALKMVAILLAVAMLCQPAQAFAWDRHHGGGGSHHYPSYGKVSWWLPAAFATLVIAGMTYYYSQGVYYRRAPRGYVVVTPPAGAVVTAVPAGYQPIVINGVTYYTSDGIYYQQVPQGYMIVQQPVTVVNAQPLPQSTVIGQTPSPVQDSPDEFTVNIPNGRGGYTPVLIRRSGKGFVGPQGEYYAGFPRVEQLKVMYGN